jgi:hypothetical protein
MIAEAPYGSNSGDSRNYIIVLYYVPVPVELFRDQTINDLAL